jgi:hypothetical protein
MADNLSVTPGTGANIAMDEVSLGGNTVKVGYGKILDATSDSTNALVVTAAGAAKVDGSAVTQPVSGTVTVANPTTNPETGLAKDVSLLETHFTEDALSSGGEKGELVLGVRQDSDTSPVSGSGDFHTFIFDEVGRLKVGTAPASIAATTGNITGISQTVSVDVSRSSNIMFYCTGTFSTVNCAFEGSIDGGTSWFAIQAVRSNANTIETTTGNLSAAPAYAWEASVNGLTNFRLRSTAWTSGTQAWRIQPGSYATEPIPAAQISGTQPVSGTVGVTGYPTAAAGADALANPTITQIGADNMVFNGTTWDRQRGMGLSATTGDTGAKTATGNGATITNVGNKGVQVFIILGAVTGTTPTCTFKLQGSVDGTNFYDIPGATTASLTASTNVGISVYPGQAVTAGTTTTGTTATASGILPRSWRVVWTIGGTTPSFTITSITYNYIPN